MIDRLPLAFVAGFISVVAPCVLPLVPGYLSAVSAVEPGRLGERGVSRRVVLASIPFIFGFTVVFVILGTTAAALSRALGLNQIVLEAIAGFILVVLGLMLMGLLPWPERVIAPSLLARARSRGRGSSALLGAAFAVCAAPCIGPVLASVLVLATDSDTVAQGSLLLAAYSAGLGAAFVLAGIAFAKAMGAFRWLRDHYTYIRVVSGTALVGFGLLFFFGRSWWLSAFLDRLKDAV